ncbi:MAG: hypothetical protein AMJ60_09845 [Desulfobacterales bacterium SG8_35]|nr:MAG: hypothetical protein AMJ60_09845 [Desulfobacterales bacterium SG8_35]
MKNLLNILAVCISIAIISGSALAKPPIGRNSNVEKSLGQTLYLPIAHMNFSYDPGDGQIIYQRIHNRITIRNKDRYNNIMITSLEIYDPDGQLVVYLSDTPIILEPLAATSYGMPPEIPFDKTGNGSNGRYSAILTWQADDYVVQPNIGTTMALGL